MINKIISPNNNKAVLEPQVSPAFDITYLQIIVIFDLWTKRWPLTPNNPRWPLPHTCWGCMCSAALTHVFKSHGNTSKYVDTVTISEKHKAKRSMTPTWPLTPLLLRSHVWLYPRNNVSKYHGNTSKYVDTVTIFEKHEPKGQLPQMTHRWPLNLLLLRSHVQLCPRILVFKFHGNTMHNDHFFKTCNQRVNDPKWSLGGPLTSLC